MQTRDERPVLLGERVVRSHSKVLPDWESARLFLELVRRGSFRATADYIGLSVNALRKRISDFEKSLGVTLVTRHVDGVRLTAEGEKILAAANQMEQAAFGLVQTRDRTDTSMAGEVRLAVTEGLGTLWVATHLVEFQRANPKLLLDVHCAMRSMDVLRLEADISVQLTRPTAKELRVAKLGRLHLVPFAAQSYIDTYGVPKDIPDLVNHRVVLQSDDHQLWDQMYDKLFPGVRPEGWISLRTNSSSAHYWSIARGAGLGMLPTYVHAVGAPVVPVDLGMYMPIDIWMTYHAGSARIPRVRRLIDWLVSVFSPKKYPWFRDEFIAPADLVKLYRGTPVVSPFAGLVAENRKAG